MLAVASRTPTWRLLQGFSNGMPEQPDMHATIFNLAVMHGGNRTYSAMQKLYLEVCPTSQASVSFRCSKGGARSCPDNICLSVEVSAYVSPRRVSQQVCACEITGASGCLI